MNTVEAELINNKLKVEKVVYANQNNKYRLDQAESKLTKMDDIENKAQKEQFRMNHHRLDYIGINLTTKSTT